MSAPVVFLDFEGVINSQATRSATREGWKQLDRAMVGRVQRIVDATGAEVVISSTWRILDSVGTLSSMLRAAGFTGDVVGVTPNFNGKHRGFEIAAWREAAEHTGPFVILDDGSDMAHLKHRLVQTDDAVGITDEHVERAIAMLTEKP